ncbi:MAG TPA: disulfide oxidoreductase [Candidatus Polarisedimenticolaceae bacterium]|nr:disulfide oxidoreductase [Candidatus Polarisedimenticolaceae bacterium]
MSAQTRNLVHYSVYLGFAMALVATLSSLYLSNVMALPPCVLCWYQRIAMYPLVIILGVGILRRERAVYQYVLPLAAIGWLIALYHSLLQWKIIPDALAPCVQGISCTTVQINLLGFITIPFMSLIAFSIIIASMIILIMHERSKRS